MDCKRFLEYFNHNDVFSMANGIQILFITNNDAAPPGFDT